MDLFYSSNIEKQSRTYNNFRSLHSFKYFFRIRIVDTNYGQHMDALERAARGGARCGASCVDRSDRL